MWSGGDIRVEMYSQTLNASENLVSFKLTTKINQNPIPTFGQESTFMKMNEMFNILSLKKKLLKSLTLKIVVVDKYKFCLLFKYLIIGHLHLQATSFFIMMGNQDL